MDDTMNLNMGDRLEFVGGSDDAFLIQDAKTVSLYKDGVAVCSIEMPAGSLPIDGYQAGCVLADWAIVLSWSCVILVQLILAASRPPGLVRAVSVALAFVGLLCIGFCARVLLSVH